MNFKIVGDTCVKHQICFIYDPRGIMIITRYMEDNQPCPTASLSFLYNKESNPHIWKNISKVKVQVYLQKDKLTMSDWQTGFKQYARSIVDLAGINRKIENWIFSGCNSFSQLTQCNPRERVLLIEGISLIFAF